MVAGVIGARANNGVGVVGACWNCSLMPVKVIGSNGAGAAVDIAEGITWAVEHGARVLNLSFTMNGYDEGVARALDHARARGAVVVAAAGNSGGEDVTFPANHPGVLSVTATDPADGRYAWATHGRWVGVAAPGCSQSTAAGGGYGDFCGTSSAAAFVSGLVGLARSLAPARGADEVGAALTSSPVAVGDFVGTGRVDAAAALASLRP
jgi:subtilisin family serine protease